MAAEIRPARSDDVDALEEIENAAFDAERISKRSFGRLVASPSASVIVAADAGIDGYCVVLFRTGSRRARLYSIAVRPGNGKAGLGRLLLDAAADLAARRGCDTLRLEVRRDNARAIKLYEFNGFRMTGAKPGYYADGHDALLYEKRVRRSEAVGGSGPGGRERL